MKERKLSDAQIKVLERGTQKGYSWLEIPHRKLLTDEDKRIFTRPTLKHLLRRGYIRYQPARYYVTGKGRKALKDVKP